MARAPARATGLTDKRAAFRFPERALHRDQPERVEVAAAARRRKRVPARPHDLALHQRHDSAVDREQRDVGELALNLGARPALAAIVSQELKHDSSLRSLGIPEGELLSLLWHGKG